MEDRRLCAGAIGLHRLEDLMPELVVGDVIPRPEKIDLCFASDAIASRVFCASVESMAIGHSLSLDPAADR